jgi:hypothetical protein
MTTIFAALGCWNAVFLLATLWLAWVHSPWHWAAGLATGIYTLLVHSIVFMHFIGTGKGVKEAIEVHGLPDDPQSGYARRARKFKAAAFPHALFASLAIIVAIWLGGWYHSQRWLDRVEDLTAFQWHRWFAYAAAAYNLCALWLEWRVMRQNAQMIRELNARIARKPRI